MWKSCNRVSGCRLTYLECHPAGIIRRSRTKVIVATSMFGNYPVYSMQPCLLMHRIMLETYCPKPLSEVECDHRNMDTMDFSLGNLRWVSKSLNLAFRPARGYTTRVTKKGIVRYIPQFRKKNYPVQDTALKAFLYHRRVKNKFIKQERERLIQLVMAKGCSREEAKVRLNWDERDERNAVQMLFPTSQK